MRSTGGPLFEFLAKLVQDKWKCLKLITSFFSQTYLSNSEVGRPDIFRPEKIFNHDRLCIALPVERLGLLGAGPEVSS